MPDNEHSNHETGGAWAVTPWKVPGCAGCYPDELDVDAGWDRLHGEICQRGMYCSAHQPGNWEHLLQDYWRQAAEETAELIVQAIDNYDGYVDHQTAARIARGINDA